MLLTWENAEWVDGPKLMAWLDVKDVKASYYGNFGRRASDWRKGAAADFYTVDRLLTLAGLHPMDLPEDAFRGSPKPPARPKVAKRSRVRLSPQDVLDIRSRLRGGARQNALARVYGVTPRAIRHVANGDTWANVKEPAA